MPELKDFRFWKGVIAEFVAMTLFVYVGVGTAISNFTYANNPAAHLITALAFGFCITALVYATAHTSGGHINPAVTLGLTIMGVCHPIQAVLYMIVQFAGASLGATLVMLQAPGLKEYGTNKRARFGSFVNTSRGVIYSHSSECGGGSNPHCDVSYGSAATFEIMGTFLLMFVVCETAVNVQSIATPRAKGTMSAGFAPSGANVAPIAIGFAVFLAHCVGIPLTGCGINPARSFGSYIVSERCWGKSMDNGRWCHEEDFWIFALFPFLGAVLAAVLCRFVFDSHEDTHTACTSRPRRISNTEQVHVKPQSKAKGPPSSAALNRTTSLENPMKEVEMKQLS